MTKDIAEKYLQKYQDLIKFCNENSLGFPFAYGRGVEIAQASTFGHNIASTFSKEDATTQDNKKAEYKATMSKTLKATYNGISVKPSWEEQVKYLKEEKIACYPEHYITRYCPKTGKFLETWVLGGEDVLKILEPKIKKQFEDNRNKADPRLGVTLGKKEIKKYGRKIE